MRYRTKIAASLGLLAAGVITMAGVLYWGADRAQYNLQRAHTAHEEYAAYLALSAETFRLFKKIRRDLMDGAGETRLDVALSKQRLTQRLDRIRAEIENERALGLRSGEEDSETRRLADLTEQIDLALAEVSEVERLLGAGQRDQALALLSTTLEERIDRQVSAIIDSGLADERAEVEEAKAITESLAWQLRATALIAAAGAVSFALLSVWFLLARLRRPLKALEEGTRRIAAGQFAQSIETAGSDEFAALATHFNAMAGQLGNQRRALDDARRNLERQVADRTTELRNANAQLSQRDEMRSRFFADIGHELRTPITAMRGLAEVAMRAKHDREAVYRTALGRVVDVSAQLTRLVNDLFLIARSDAGALDLQKAPVDLETVVNAVAQDMGPLYREAGARLRIETPNRPVVVAGDRERLRQALMILVDNALKHGPKAVAAKIKLTTGDAHCTVKVIDNGRGIEARDLGQVFNRFYRGNDGNAPAAGSSGPSAGNSGLGLPIARSMVQGHGGEIKVHSKPGTGTMFTITLPLLPRSGIADGTPASDTEAA